MILSSAQVLFARLLGIVKVRFGAGLHVAPLSNESGRLLRGEIIRAQLARPIGIFVRQH